MKVLLTWLIAFSFFTEPSSKSIETKIVAESDSVAIHNVSSKFYDWFLNNLTGPKEIWENKELKIDSKQYFNELQNLNIVSSIFIGSEKKRFEKCSNAAKKISYDRVFDCGCSIAMLVNECDFFNNYYWISSQEVYHGFDVSNIKVKGNKATSNLTFYYEYDSKKHTDQSFSIEMSLSKKGGEWLIDEIYKIRTRPNNGEHP